GDGDRGLPRRDRHPQRPHARGARAVRPPHLGLPELVRPPAPAPGDRAGGPAGTRVGRGRLMTSLALVEVTRVRARGSRHPWSLAQAEGHRSPAIPDLREATGRSPDGWHREFSAPAGPPRARADGL